MLLLHSTIESVGEILLQSTAVIYYFALYHCQTMRSPLKQANTEYSCVKLSGTSEPRSSLVELGHQNYAQVAGVRVGHSILSVETCNRAGIRSLHLPQVSPGHYQAPQICCECLQLPLFCHRLLRGLRGVFIVIKFNQLSSNASRLA